jgi:hypothetical protein
MVALDIKELWAKFEAQGEKKVREGLAMQWYGQPDSYKERLALDWLREKELARADEAARRIEASVAQQIEIARSSKNATWTAAVAAIIAAVVAIISAIVAVRAT